MKKSLGAKTLAYPTPVWLVGTYDKEGTPNIMTVAWGGICCSKPPCVNISLRKATYTYASITDKQAFTVNIPSEDYIKEADYCGIVSGKDVNKFAVAGLTPVRSEQVEAPYVAECPLILECKVLHAIEIGLHTQFVGEIVDVKVDDWVAGESDVPTIEKVKPLIFAPEMRNYYGVGKYLGKAFSIGKEILA